MGLIDAAVDVLNEMTGDEEHRTDRNDESANVARAPARCMHSEDVFLIRFEKRGGAWAALDTSVPSGGDGEDASSTDASRISGPFEFPRQYDGCPHCSNTGLFLCADCDNLACWDGDTNPVVCPWCSARNPIRGDIESIDATEQSSSNDRPPSDVTHDRATSDTTSDWSSSIRHDE